MALGKKRRKVRLCFRGDGSVGHHGGRKVVGIGLRHANLPVIGLFAQAFAGLGAPAGAADQVVHGSVQLGVRHTAVDQPPLRCGLGADGVARHGHFQGVFAVQIAGHRHQRRVAKVRRFTARQGKTGLVRGNRQIAGGHQLAAACRGQGMHLGNHRLRHGLHGVQHGAAGVKNVAGGGQVHVHHVGKVVAAAKHRAVGGQYHAASIAVAHGFKSAVQFGNHRQRQGVAFVGAVQRDGGDAIELGNEQVVVRQVVVRQGNLLQIQLAMVSPMRRLRSGTHAGLNCNASPADAGNNITTVEPSKKRPISSPWFSCILPSG